MRNHQFIQSRESAPIADEFAFRGSLAGGGNGELERLDSDAEQCMKSLADSAHGLFLIHKTLLFGRQWFYVRQRSLFKVQERRAQCYMGVINHILYTREVCHPFISIHLMPADFCVLEFPQLTAYGFETADGHCRAICGIVWQRLKKRKSFCIQHTDCGFPPFRQQGRKIIANGDIDFLNLKTNVYTTDYVDDVCQLRVVSGRVKSSHLSSNFSRFVFGAACDAECRNSCRYGCDSRNSVPVPVHLSVSICEYEKFTSLHTGEGA